VWIPWDGVSRYGDLIRNVVRLLLDHGAGVHEAAGLTDSITPEAGHRPRNHFGEDTRKIV
jgi:hypothetical protein